MYIFGNMYNDLRKLWLTCLIVSVLLVDLDVAGHDQTGLQSEVYAAAKLIHGHHTAIQPGHPDQHALKHIHAERVVQAWNKTGMEMIVRRKEGMGFYVALNSLGYIATSIETRKREEIPFSSQTVPMGL